MDEHLTGKVAVVTGGMSEIGAACARALAQAGAHIIIADLHTENAASVSAQISAGTDRQVVALQTDVSDPEQCAHLMQQSLQQFNRLDILINCAAIFADEPALQMGAAHWRSVFDVNLHGAYFCAQVFARHIISQQTRGTIVNISSIASTNNAPGIAAYGVSKAAINHLTRALALEWARHNIRVNAVAPSHVNTALIRQADAQGHLDMEHIASRIPLGRLAAPAEIADAVLFLCSPQSRFMTGQIIFVDGGFSVNNGWKKMPPATGAA